MRNIEIAPLACCKRLENLYMFQENHPFREPFTILSQESMDRIVHNNTKSKNMNYWLGKVVEDMVVYQPRFDVPHPYRNLNLIGWLAGVVKEHEPDNWKMAHLVQCIVDTVCTEEIGLLDIDLETLKSIIGESEYALIKERIIEAFCKQIDAGGTTIGMDIDRLSQSCHHEIVHRLPKVIELRKYEMESVAQQIDSSGDTIDLRPLWLTAYGHKLLSSLKLSLECTAEAFKLVERGLSEIGYPLDNEETKGSVESSTPISENMKHYIWRNWWHGLQPKEIVSALSKVTNPKPLPSSKVSDLLRMEIVEFPIQVPYAEIKEETDWKQLMRAVGVDWRETCRQEPDLRKLEYRVHNSGFKNNEYYIQV